MDNAPEDSARSMREIRLEFQFGQVALTNHRSERLRSRNESATPEPPTDDLAADAYPGVDDDIRAGSVAYGMPVVAITNQGNLFALVKFYKAAEGAG